MIDNASTDNCGKICDEYAKIDSRVKVFHKQTNHGSGGARNIGLDMAKGDFINYLDSDDYVDPDYLENLLEPFKNDLNEEIDVVLGGLTNQKAGYKPYPKQIEDNIETMKRYLIDANVGTFWNKLYRRSVLKGFRHREEYISNGDVVEQWEIFAYHARKWYYNDSANYHYTPRNDSLFRNWTYAKGLQQNRMKSFYEIFKDCSNTFNRYKEVFDLMQFFIFHHYWNSMRKVISNKDEFEKYFRNTYEQMNSIIVSFIETFKNNFVREQFLEMFSKGFDATYKYYDDRFNKLLKAKAEGNKIYIFGGAGHAYNTKILLSQRNISIDAFLLSPGYNPDPDFYIYCDGINERKEDIVVLHTDEIERNENNIIILGIGIFAAEKVVPKLLADNCEELIIL